MEIVEPLVKKLRISRWRQQSIILSWIPEPGALSDCTGYLPTRPHAHLKDRAFLSSAFIVPGMHWVGHRGLVNWIFWVGFPLRNWKWSWMTYRKQRTETFSCNFTLQFGTVRSISISLCPNLSAYEPFIQQIFIEHLPCAKHCSRSWQYSSEQNKQKTCVSLWPTFCWGR